LGIHVLSAGRHHWREGGTWGAGDV